MEREFPVDIPWCFLILQAFECMLCEVAPVPTAHCPAGAWSKRATQRFIELTANRKLAAKVVYKKLVIKSVSHEFVSHQRLRDVV